MGGQKLSAKAEEEVVFLETLLQQIAHLAAKTEEYAGTKKGDDILQAITRQLNAIRQNAMMKNLGPVADSAGILAIAVGRGSQMQRTRMLREGLTSYQQLIERTMKATIGADLRKRAEDEKVMAQRAATQNAAAPHPAPGQGE